MDDLQIIDRENPSHVQETIQALEKIFISYLPALPPPIDPIKDLKIKDIDFTQLYKNRQVIEDQVMASPCHTCKHMKEQVCKKILFLFFFCEKVFKLQL